MKIEGNVKIIIIPKWIPEFIKRWIFKNGKDGDLYIRNGEEVKIGRDMFYHVGIIENGGTLIANGWRLYFDKLIFNDGEIKR